MIYPIQKVLPLLIPDESVDTIREKTPDLGPLHLHICDGIDFTSKHQLPLVKPEYVDPPSKLETFYRLKKLTDEEKKHVFGHFYTSDANFEKVWNKPHSFIEEFRKFGAILSPDYSLYVNMVEIQRQWNDFRNKLLSAFYQKWNVTVIASPSWSADMNNFKRYMEGWPHKSVIAINSTGVCRDKRSRHIWLDGYFAMLDILQPTHILRYGGMIDGERREISTYYSNNNKIMTNYGR